MQRRRAMFPLGSVLLPGMPLPLHIFEPRYREMFRQLLESPAPFGVVLIERGHEVGGGEVRSLVGTLATVSEQESFPDGRLAVAARGVRRIRVASWLPDDPYPLAMVEDWPDPAPSTQTADLLRQTVDLTAQTITAIPSIHGPDSPEWQRQLSDDYAMASYQLTSMAPVGPFDRQRLLAAPTIDERLSRLSTLLNEVIEVIRLQSEGDTFD